jgi:hypothetical protein
MVGMQTLAYNKHSHSSKYKGRNKLRNIKSIDGVTSQNIKKEPARSTHFLKTDKEIS